MSILFTLGIYQTDRPGRWISKHSNIYYLGETLRKMGAKVHYYCNRESIKSKFLDSEHYSFQDEEGLAELCCKLAVDTVVIWGGRTEADNRIRSELGNSVRFIYGEFGWFPQKGTCYFSPYGTNASARFMDEGLREHQLDESRFKRSRNRLLRQWLGWIGWFNALPFEGEKRIDITKPILVPLQDEKDTNITISSPVKTMSELIRRLSKTYPEQKFIVRPHPRASYGELPRLANVDYQDVNESPFREYRSYGGVIGINSTMLMQFSLLGLPVIALGAGVASGCGAYIECDFNDLPDSLQSVAFDVSNGKKFFDFLLATKQIDVIKLKDLYFVRNSYLYDLFMEDSK